MNFTYYQNSNIITTFYSTLTTCTSFAFYFFFSFLALQLNDLDKKAYRRPLSFECKCSDYGLRPVSTAKEK